jgi:glucosylceramidase
VGTHAAAFKRPDGKIVILIQNEGAKKNLSIDKLNIELAAESGLTIVL